MWWILTRRFLLLLLLLHLFHHCPTHTGDVDYCWRKLVRPFLVTCSFTQSSFNWTQRNSIVWVSGIYCVNWSSGVSSVIKWTIWNWVSTLIRGTQIRSGPGLSFNSGINFLSSLEVLLLVVTYVHFCMPFCTSQIPPNSRRRSLESKENNNNMKSGDR